MGALLYVTFLQVPAAELVGSLRDRRFLAAALVVTFAVVPCVVAAMFSFLPGDQAVRLGVPLVLLCPCVDWVIVFTGLAGSSRRLLAATPLLLVVQMLALPVFLFVFVGSALAHVVDVVDVGPFLQAFLSLIVFPLALAWTTQARAARRPTGQKTSNAAITTVGVTVRGVAACLHLLVTLPDAQADDMVLAERLCAEGVLVLPLSRHRRRPGPPGLVLGYAAHPPDRLREAAATIIRVVHRHLAEKAMTRSA
ncbi:arsenite transporter [Frankia sp. AgKG'84/4]|nr:hypothetical protein [Frankia sp. AgKG'84/4]MCL9795863.1 hypothetical protein [Frankia sp. AgKG'84/4]